MIIDYKEALDAIDWFMNETKPATGLGTEQFWNDRHFAKGTLEEMAERFKPARAIECGTLYKCPECGNYLTSIKESIERGRYCEDCGQYVKGTKDEDSKQ